MLKKDSKRRWIARARNGGWIPHTAAMQHPGLIDRLREMGLLYSPTVDGWAEGCKSADLTDLTVCARPNAKAPLPPTVT